MAAPELGSDDPTPPLGFPLPSVRPRRSYRKLWRALLAAALAVVVLAAGHTAVRLVVDGNTYDDGHSAYQRADCAAAIGAFDDVINAWRIVTLGGTVARAESEKAECLVFQEAVTRQQTGNTPGALASYTAFIPGRPPSPLVDAARARVTELFKQPDPGKLATIESCDALPVLRDQKLLDTTSAPTFLAACGAAYLHGGDRTKSVATYVRLFSDYSTDKIAAETEAALQKDLGWCLDLERFKAEPVLTALKDLIPGLLLTCAKDPNAPTSEAIEYAQDFLKNYPGHRFAPEMLATYATVLNRAIRAKSGSRDFGAAHVDGTTGGPSAILMLYNDSPEKFQIALSGPEPRVEEIAPCPDCPINPPDSSSKVCSKSAILKRIVITPGEYDIAIGFEEDKTNGAYGHWSLQPGKQYFGCYSISEPAR